ncbi:MAG TPA: hypothetical protein VMH90_03720, partial [Thermoplasmata archaeon]|nr:hypothetical protein [Thermoplasmata archaeon]
WTVAAAAWGADGRLNLSVGSQRAGTWFLNLSPAEGPPAGPVGISLTVRADAVAPQLRDPSDAREGPRSGSTLYRIVDPYGNPIPEGFVVVRSAFPSGVLTVDEPIRDGSVWVNYTAIGSSAGTVVVLSEYGVALLPTILVPAVAVATLAWDGPAILTGAAVVTAVAVVLAVRGRHRGPPAPPGNDAELERHAAGRDHLLRKLAEGPCDAFPALASGWTGPPPRPERHELVEWLEALIADGLVVAQIGPAGRPEFLRADAGEVRSDLVLDDAALERALSRRDVPDDAGIRASPDTGEDVDGSAPPPGP